MSTPRPETCPPDLDPASKTLWRRTLATLRAQGTWQDSDAPALERYVRATALYHSARKTAAVEPWVEGSKGQLVAHPALKVAREAAADADRFARALLLTPEARKRHDVSAASDDALLATIG